MRWIVRLGIPLLALVLLAPLLALSIYLDSAISRAATYALGVETNTTVLLRPLAGRLQIFGLSVENPPGFESDHFLALDSGRFELSLATLREQTIEAPLLRLEGVEVALEKKGGKTNYQTILGNLKRFESGRKAEPPPEAVGGRQFVIRELVIRDVLAHVDFVELLGPRGRIDVEIPEIRLVNVGSGHPVKLSELTDVIVKAILAAVARHGVNLPLVLTQELTQQLGGLAGIAFDVTGKVTGGVIGVGDAVTGGAVSEVTERAGGALGRAAGGAEAVGEGAAGVVRKGLGGLLGGGEESGER